MDIRTDPGADRCDGRPAAVVGASVQQLPTTLLTAGHGGGVLSLAIPYLNAELRPSGAQFLRIATR